MKNTLLSKLLIISAALFLSACGGGGDSGSSTPAPTYGSIYVNITNGGAGISSNYPSQAEADTAAQNICYTYSLSNRACYLEIQFGANSCGALARSVQTGYSGKFGAGTASSGSVAESIAISRCLANGGTNCSIGLSMCNGSGTPSSRLSGITTGNSDSGTASPSISQGEAMSDSLKEGWTPLPD